MFFSFWLPWSIFPNTLQLLLALIHVISRIRIQSELFWKLKWHWPSGLAVSTVNEDKKIVSLTSVFTQFVIHLLNFFYVLTVVIISEKYKARHFLPNQKPWIQKSRRLEAVSQLLRTFDVPTFVDYKLRFARLIFEDVGSSFKVLSWYYLSPFLSKLVANNEPPANTVIGQNRVKIPCTISAGNVLVAHR